MARLPVELVAAARGQQLLRPPGRCQGLGPSPLALSHGRLGEGLSYPLLQHGLPGDPITQDLFLSCRPVTQHPTAATTQEDEEEQDQTCDRQASLIPSGELAEAIPRRRRARLHRLIRQVTLHVRPPSPLAVS